MSELKKHLERMGIPHTKESVNLAEIEGIIMGRLRSYRKENNLTQKQFAEKTGVSCHKLSKAEKGQILLTIKDLNSIVYACDGAFCVDFDLPLEDPYQELKEVLE